MAERPFAPGFTAKPKSNEARDLHALPVQITRTDGQQELKGVDITLPPGATAKLEGVPYCPPAEIADAADRSGAAEQQKPQLPGRQPGRRRHGRRRQRRLAAEDRGRGLPRRSATRARRSRWSSSPRRSPARSTSATSSSASPLYLEPETAQIHPVDRDPRRLRRRQARHPLDLRQRQPQRVHPQRDQLPQMRHRRRRSAAAGRTRPTRRPSPPSRSPTRSRRPAARSSSSNRAEAAPVRRRPSAPRTRNCAPILKARAGQANIAPRLGRRCRTRSSSTRPAWRTICTRVQFAADECPKKSVYGHARAFTPLLGKPLEGPVYLRSSNNTAARPGRPPQGPGRHRPRRPDRQLPEAASAPPSTASPTCR